MCVCMVNKVRTSNMLFSSVEYQGKKYKFRKIIVITGN